LFLIASSNEAGTGTTVSVFPSSVTANLGQNFSINVNVTGVSDLYGWEFSLNWTATILNVVNVTEGPFLKSGGSTFFYYNLNATEGHMTVEDTLLGNVQGVSGSGVLATITFNVKSSGQSPLNLYYALLINSSEQVIPCQLTGGNVYPSHDVAVTNVNVSPITVLPGTIVHVNATVQDLGGFAETFNVTAYANSQSIGVQKVSLSSGSSKTLLFTWNTTGYSTGDYIVSAVASTVPGETNTANNVKAAANIVTILYNGHYIAVVSVKSIKTVVGQGYCDNIDVTAKNFGVYTERFNVTAYANTTAIQTQTPNLTSGNNVTLTFTWSTSSFAKGNYTIWAYATPVPGQTDTSNNTLTDGRVLVSIPGDVDGEKMVTALDLGLIGISMFTKPGMPGWNPNCDITNAGAVSAIDMAIAGMHLFQKW
jgi:hypothetical protein